MPLDTGAVAEFDRIGGHNRATGRGSSAVLDDSVSLGAALRAARQAAGLTVADIARATRVRPSHVEAIERFDLGALPSRPFAIGYVRAYANALGADEDRAVGRFRSESPDADTVLRGPGGIDRRGRRRAPWLTAGVVIAVGALVGWNISRHAPSRAPRQGLVASAAAPRPATGPAHLGAPLPAPAEATTPAVYETPGLAAVIAGGPAAAGQSKLAGSPSAPAKASATSESGASFVPAGAIYGAAGGASAVVFQAKVATSLVVRGQGGAVYFARQLSAGQAWRAPATPGLIVDVGNPASMEVFVGGVSRGTLSEALTPVSRFAS